MGWGFGSNPFPCLTTPNRSDVRLANMKKTTNFAATQSSFQHANLPDLIVSKFVVKPPFVVPVGAVHRVGAEKKVIWIYTCWSVAFVQHQPAVRNGTIDKFPRKSVRQNLSAAETAESTVTIGSYKASPQPTGLGFVDSHPKTLKNWNSAGNSFLRHIGLSRSSICLGQLGSSRSNCPILPNSSFSRN